MTQTGWAFEYAMSRPLVAMYAFHSYMGRQYSAASGIPDKYRTGTREWKTPEGRQEVRTYYLGDVKDDPKMQAEIEDIFGVVEK